MILSTSNSESSEPIGERHRKRFKPTKFLGRGFILFLVFLIAAEVFVFRNVMVYGYSPGFIGQLAEIAESFDHTDASQIQTAIFGDSTGMDGLRPDLIARDLGRPSETVYNFSLSGGSAYDIAQMYKHYIDRLPNVQDILVVVNEHQLNSYQAEKDDKFRFFAGLRDRLQVMDLDNFGELLVGWALKSYDMRTVWHMMIEKYRAGKLRDEIPWAEGGLPAVKWSPKTDKTPEHAADVADRWFDHYQLQGVRAAAFEWMIADMRARGHRVIILQLPRTRLFEDAIQQKYAQQQQAFVAKVNEIAAQQGASFHIMSNQGLDAEDFRDTNHISPYGAEQVSHVVVEQWLEK